MPNRRTSIKTKEEIAKTSEEQRLKMKNINLISLGTFVSLLFVDCVFAAAPSHEEDMFDDAATLVAEDTDSVYDVGTDEFSANMEEDSVGGRIEQQKILLKENKPGKNYSELEILQKNGFVVTRKSLADLEKNFNNAVAKIDLFELVNTNAALIEAFNFAMDKNAKTNFISGEYNLPRDIKKNPELYEKMQNFVKGLNNDSVDKKDLQVQNLENLKNIYSLLKKDEKIGEKNVFSKFVKGMINVYQVLIARRLADEIMAKYRSSNENSLITTRKSSSVGAGAIATNGAAGASTSYHKDEGSADTSFYTISVGGGARLSVGAGVAGVGAEVGASVDVTKSAVFYSLEQLLDSGKIKTGVFSSKDMKQTLKSRKKMQDREKELLSIFGKDVEGYLKMIGKIPVSVYLEWPKLTKASPSEEATNVSKSIDASLSALEAIGLNVVANDDVKTWKRPSGYMTLVSDDCSPSDGLSATDIVEFLGKQYDISETFGGKSDVNILPVILGDIRAYNSVLNILAEDKSDKKAEQRKHDIEGRWLPKHKFTSEGRLGVLKSMIATVSVLRESAITDREIELFKQLHSEMSRLAKLLEFSKNKSSRSATFMTESTAHNKAIQASASVAIPMFGDAQISFTRSVSRDNPFQEENGDCMFFDLVLPLTPTGIVGTGVVRKSLNEYRRLMGKSHATSDFGSTFSLAQDGLSIMQDGLGIPVAEGVSASVSGSAIFTVGMVRVDAPEPIAYPSRNLSESGPVMTDTVRPLPNKKLLTKDKNEWVVLYYKGAAYMNSGIGKDFKALNLSYSSSIGKEKIIIGTNTLGYLTARFNAFSIGLQDSKDAMSPWYTLKRKQEKRLMELFKNITDEKSNVLYELQNMYNSIMDNIGKKDSKTSKKCTQLFSDFISACDGLVEAKDKKSKEKAFVKVSDLMDQIFRMNFDYNFMSDYRKAYKVKN